MYVDNKQKIAGEHQFWDIKKSGERLLWRFAQDEKGNFKNFTPNHNDFIALKSVLAWINRQSSGIVARSPVTAKLYLMYLIGEIRYHETTVFNEFIFHDLSRKLAMPLNLYYRTFYDDLCSNQLNRLTKENFSDKEGNAVIVDYLKFKEDFPLEDIVEGLNERMISILHRRSSNV